MEEILSELKKLGFKAIAQKTLMTEQSVKAIINKDFKSLQKTKAIGFIKIIEREFKVNLSEWVDEYHKYLSEHQEEQEEHFVMSEPSKDEGNKLINIFTYFIIFISVIALFYILSDINSVKENEDVKPVKELVEEAKVNLEITKELNESVLILNENNETNQSVGETKEELKESEDVVKESLDEVSLKKEVYIVPKFKVWVGLIFLPDYRKRTFVSSEKFEIDTSKEQLISLGHSKLDIYLNGKKIDLEGKEKFHYKDGKIKPLTFAEFRDLNRGKNW